MATGSEYPAAAGPLSGEAISFRGGKTDWGEWAFDHQAGLLTTVIVILSMAIVFVTAQIVTGRSSAPEMMAIELTPMPEPEPEQQVQRPSDAGGEDDKALNRISNLGAAKTGEGARNAASVSGDAELDRRAQQVGEDTRANREAYERGMREVAAMGRKTSDGGGATAAKGDDTRVKGRVTVSFSLINPLRTAVNLYIPAYRCQGGGEVTVLVAVGRNGNVVSAAVDRQHSSSDPCLTDMAVTAAYASRFNTDPSAPENQKGTINYIFIAQ